LIHTQPQDPAAATEALKFFAWAYKKGGKMAAELDYPNSPQSYAFTASRTDILASEKTKPR